jgi:hypothetical protein
LYIYRLEIARLQAIAVKNRQIQQISVANGLNSNESRIQTQWHGVLSNELTGVSVPYSYEYQKSQPVKPRTEMKLKEPKLSATNLGLSIDSERNTSPSSKNSLKV